MKKNASSNEQILKNKASLGEIIKKYFSYIFLIVMFVAFTLINTSFIKPGNLLNILEQSTVILTMGMGATFVIMSGSIDLSLGSVMGLSAAVMVMAVNAFGWVGIILGVLTGVVCGIINGIIYSEAKIPSFIVTLGMMVSARGLVYIVTDGSSELMNRGVIRDLGIKSLIGGVPNIFLGFIIVFVVYFVILNFTPFGRNIKAIGGNEEVAMLSGINLKRSKKLIFALGGLSTGIAGVLAGIRMGAASPTLGTGYELDVIAAIVLGGTTLSGGVGKLKGTIIGGIIMGMLANGMNMAGISSYYQLVIRGIVVVVAVILTIDRKSIKFVK